ncbi:MULTISPECIES: hypothetical protein [Rhodopseudomonas]|uniref:Glycosyltransferase RgtA/B/C/D-like domain-containing protein n=1 Tax=Rhodopseudomonas palustris TaxID=1076 RepID=A0A0D7F1P3_RHOPL|nr:MULTISPECIES: hypothetical protein [Rhodopseudomonas]KIZ47028.1 hypothetical protein OO17_05730 [Rhodopseudomonas palustris]MDF3813993.1 hypothetical protein [Rhodopseudomonas sp. BAL398]WOK19953.1 hypothetical protein RBJ75_10740 [Rhodopseudomonas sp. BAL398]
MSFHASVDSSANPETGGAQASHLRTSASRQIAIATGLICALIFLIQYAFNAATPHAGIPGWTGWADQGAYLKSTIDFAKLGFNPAEHRYPPLYSLLALPFLRLYPTDPFLFVNIACVAASAYLLVRIFAKVAHPIAAAVLATLLLVVEPRIASAYVIPWTSTIVSPLAFGCIYMLQQSEQRQPSYRHSFFFALLIGLAFLARPLDGVILGAALLPFWCWPFRRSWREAIRHASVLAAGGLIGPFLLLLNNLIIFRSPISPYMVESNDRLRLMDIPEKFVSLFLDSAPLYFDGGQTVLNAFPWFVISMAIIASLLVFGSRWVRATAILVVLMSAIYLSYDDLFPSGLFHFGNYHYLKWPLVLGGMLVLPFLAAMRRASALRIIATLAIFAGVAVTACLHLETANTPVAFNRSGGDISVDISQMGNIDYVDISHVRGDWLQNYFFGDRAAIDGRALLYSREMKTMPATPFLQPLDGGPQSTARILFIRPKHGNHLVLNLERLQLTDSSQISVGHYSFGLGFPRWLQRPGPP